MVKGALVAGMEVERREAKLHVGSSSNNTYTHMHARTIQSQDQKEEGEEGRKKMKLTRSWKGGTAT